MNGLFMLVLALPPLMPVGEVRPGQKGECLTVFQGNRVEPFPFEVRGVMQNFLGPGRDLVLVRLGGDKAEFTGVVAGMSGSPCSIDGKLLGALAYAFAMFAKEPIAGITPMGGMLDVFTLPDEKRPWRVSAEKASDWDAFRAGRAHAREAAPGDLRPIATPLSLGGVPPVVRAHFEPWLKEAGFEPVAGGASGGDDKPMPLVPGGAIAAVLVRGDVDIAATGTVTSVEGDKVLAFGHPFFGAGAISIPMANATILNTMVSSMRSFKMSAAGPIIGEVVQDRLTAIAGVLGRKPAMLPVDGVMVTAKGKERFHIDVARDLQLTPRFVAMGAAAAMAGRVDAGERGTVRVEARIETQGLKPITVRNVYSAERDGSLFVYGAIDAARAVSVLWDTPFGPPPEMRVHIETTYDPQPAEEWIEAIYLDRSLARPGDAMEVAVQVRRVGGPVSVERFRVAVPQAWANQEIDIVAAGVDAAESLATQVAGEPQPTALADIGRWLSERRADGRIYLLAVRRGSGLKAGVEAHPFLPPSAVVLLGGDPSREQRGAGLAWEEARPRPGIVSGLARTSVRVEFGK